MKKVTFQGKSYLVDANGFLADYQKWDRAFAEGMAPEVNIRGGVTPKHWNVIHYIRDSFRKSGRCPLVYETCRANGLFIRDLQQLFPTGYLRGACKLAGITYLDHQVNFFGEGGLGAGIDAAGAAEEAVEQKVYRVDVRGFLKDPAEWDPYFALHRAEEMGLKQGLTSRHWQILNFLRECFQKNGVVPSVYETCEANQLELEELERLFPTGYHRGAVKLAGLRVV